MDPVADPLEADAEQSSSASILRDAGNLARNEVILLRAEMRRNIRRFKVGVVLIVVGVCLGVVTVLLAPVVAILGLVHFGIGPFAASAIVTGLTGMGALVCMMLARRGMSLRRLIPFETLESLRQDVATIWATVLAQPGVAQPGADAAARSD